MGAGLLELGYRYCLDVVFRLGRLEPVYFSFKFFLLFSFLAVKDVCNIK